jgi:hypothetical protein
VSTIKTTVVVHKINQTGHGRHFFKLSFQIYSLYIHITHSSKKRGKIKRSKNYALQIAFRGRPVQSVNFSVNFVKCLWLGWSDPTEIGQSLLAAVWLLNLHSLSMVIGGGLNVRRKATAVSSKNKAHKCDFCHKTFQFKSCKIWDRATFWNVIHKKN